MNIEIWCASGQLADYNANQVPHVGEVIFLSGARRGQRTVTRVEHCIYVVKDAVVAQLEMIRVHVE